MHLFPFGFGGFDWGWGWVASVGAVIVLGIFLIPWFFFLLNLHNLLDRVDPRRRAMPSGYVWLNFIPVFNLGWAIYTVMKIRDSVKDEYSARGWAADGDFGYSVGMTAAVLAIVSFFFGWLPFIGWVVSIAGLVCWILYWLKTAELKGRLGQQGIYRPGGPQGYSSGPQGYQGGPQGGAPGGGPQGPYGGSYGQQAGGQPYGWSGSQQPPAPSYQAPPQAAAPTPETGAAAAAGAAAGAAAAEAGGKDAVDQETPTGEAGAAPEATAATESAPAAERTGGTCAACGARFDPSDVFCRSCGLRLP